MSIATVEHPVRARIGTWPNEPDVAHIVLLDHHMVPVDADIAEWVVAARRSGARAIRTGALFPASIPAFARAGFHTIDTLVLLERSLDDQETRRGPSRRHVRTHHRRLRKSDLDDAAVLDARAFQGVWSNDRDALAAIAGATPHHRARRVDDEGKMVAFAISGRAGRWGYVQRLAVDPGSRRQGLARVLVVDALTSMRRHGADRVMVNTATDNAPALALYRSLGFERRPESLSILERDLG